MDSLVNKIATPPDTVRHTITDDFSQNCRQGQVVGSHSPTGVVRRGVDAEAQMAIDNGALRFQPLMKPGWGRQGIAYGPYQRKNGLALSVFLLNGHNTSQANDIEQSFKDRMILWSCGSCSEKRSLRMLRWLFFVSKRGILRRFLMWYRHSRPRWNQPRLDENLAVGWFPIEVPNNPVCQGNAFVVHAAEQENGELWARSGTTSLPAFRSMQNVQTYYVVVLRDRGAAYYISSIRGAHGFVEYPYLRPVAIDAFQDNPTVYAGIHQSVLGQIGFRVDSRVYGVQVEQVQPWSHWYGSAHAADCLLGHGQLQHSTAEIGGTWTVLQGYYKRTPSGTCPTEFKNLAVLTPTEPAGLVHLLVETAAGLTPVGVVWRWQDAQNFWCLWLSATKCELFLVQQGVWRAIATDPLQNLQPHTVHSVQILDEGRTFSLYLNGHHLFDTWFQETHLQEQTGTGIYSPEPNPELFFKDFEAHPRRVALPPALDLGPPWQQFGEKVVVQEIFEGIAADLAGKITTVGDRSWQKTLGRGVLELLGDNAARVRASVAQPNPGRTAYTIPWHDPLFADIQTTITPPGTGPGHQERGRSGLIFWQDRDNYFIVNIWLDDHYGCASLSAFYRLRGFEEAYDAIWTNLGRGHRVFWGRPYELRISFDGNHFLALINGEPVLYRALRDIYPNARRFYIRRVGLAVNWEWGDDTGSQFRDFVARA